MTNLDGNWQPASQSWVQGGMTGMMQTGDDTKKFVIFYDKTIHNPAKSQAAGRPEYDVVCYIRMQDPGDNLTIHDRPATEGDRQRFPRHYQMYVEGRGAEQPGTPIELLFPANPELVAMLKHLKVTTIQALAGLNGHALSQIGMGAEEFKQKAAKYLDMAKEGEAYTKMAAELEKRDEEIAALKARLAQNDERFDALMKRLEGISPTPEEPVPPAATLPSTVQRRPARGMGTGEI